MENGALECSSDGPSADLERFKMSQGPPSDAGTIMSGPRAKINEAGVAKSKFAMDSPRQKKQFGAETSTAKLDRGPLARRLLTPRKVRRLPTDTELFSDRALWDRAEQAVDRSVGLTISNIPSVTNYPHPFGGGLKNFRLAGMSKDAQHTFLQVARYEAEAWLEEAKKRQEWEVKTAKRHKHFAGQLEQWYDKKKQAESLWQQHEEKCEREKARKKEQDMERWKKRSEELHQKLADMADERAAAELNGDADDKEKLEAEKKKERDAIYHKNQKQKLEEWRLQKLSKAEDQLAQEPEKQAMGDHSKNRKSKGRRPPKQGKTLAADSLSMLPTDTGYEKQLGEFQAFQLTDERVQYAGHDCAITWLNPGAFWARSDSGDQQVWVYLETHKDYMQLILPEDRHADDQQSVLDTIAAAGLEEKLPASAQQANPFVFYEEDRCWIFMMRDGMYTSFDGAEHIAAGHVG